MKFSAFGKANDGGKVIGDMLARRQRPMSYAAGCFFYRVER